MSNLRNEIWSVAKELSGPYEFAGGDIANNKLELDRIHKHPLLQAKIAYCLGKIATDFRAEAIVPIPNGGNKWAELVASLTLKPVCYLRKTDSAPGQRNYDFATDWFEKVAKKKDRILVIDDVGNKLTSLRGVLEIPILADKVVMASGIWMRGTPEDKNSVGVEQKWLVEEYIPPIISADYAPGDLVI